MIDNTREGNTIKGIVQKGLCIGCGTCVALCPKGALKISKCQQTGTYIPQLNNLKCNQCGLCLKICPGSEVNFGKLNMMVFNQIPRHQFAGNYLKCYSGYAVDKATRCKGASGGLISALAGFALEIGVADGVLTTRALDQNPLQSSSFIARTKKEVMSAVGSRYCPVSANSSLDEILKNPGRYVVIGLPCHIQGMRKAQAQNKNLKNRIALVFGIVCNHTPTFHATDYLLKKFRITIDKIAKLDYRKRGWPGGINIKMDDCSQYFIPFSSSYYWGYVFQKFFWSKRCMICDDKLCQLADIVFMDAWLPAFSSDSLGSSLIIVRSNIGEEFVRKAMENGIVRLDPISIEDVLRSQKIFISMRKAAARSLVLKYPSKNSLIFQRTGPKPSVFDLLSSFHLVLLNKLCRNTSIISQLIIECHTRLWDLACSIKRILT